MIRSDDGIRGAPGPVNLPELAETIRQATLQAALDAYEDAGIQGLCEEGRWEAAISAMRALDLNRFMPGPESIDRQGRPR
jgi:hypothetical protein